MRLGGYVLRVTFLTALVVALLMVLWRPALRLIYPIPYALSVHGAAEDYRIDPLLVVAIMRAESRFDPRAVSPKGARGLMQLMPETAEWAAEQMGLSAFYDEQIYEPDTNIAIATWYIRYLGETFDFRMPLVIAAYNAGPGHVRRWLDEGIWSGTAATLDDIPFGETRQYVRRVTDGYRLYRLLHASPHAGYRDLLREEEITPDVSNNPR